MDAARTVSQNAEMAELTDLKNVSLEIEMMEMNVTVNANGTTGMIAI